MSDLLTRLIRLANTCLLNDNPPNAPTFDPQLFGEKVNEAEFEDFMDCLQCEPPRIEFYRNQFVILDHKLIHYVDGEKVITIMRTDDGQVHTIMSEKKIVWTKEPGNEPA